MTGAAAQPEQQAVDLVTAAQQLARTSEMSYGFAFDALAAAAGLIDAHGRAVRAEQELAELREQLVAVQREIQNWQRMGWASASNYDKGGLRAANAIAAVLLSAGSAAGEPT
jgi:mannose/cellobiose epimerase-like protein (N-acyl-D-glucosamine 2-epimerase family)